MELIEHTWVTNLSTWHGVCSSKTLRTCATIGPMKSVHVVFHDGGGGHRNAAVDLQTVISQQQREWQLLLVTFQDLTYRLVLLINFIDFHFLLPLDIILTNDCTIL